MNWKQEDADGDSDEEKRRRRQSAKQETALETALETGSYSIAFIFYHSVLRKPEGGISCGRNLFLWSGEQLISSFYAFWGN